MTNDGMRGQRYFAPFNHVIELNKNKTQEVQSNGDYII
jgi:hypothetical protein